MHTLKSLLEHQPLAALFLTIAVGYLLGKVSLKGLSLGAGAVLFVALAVGWVAPRSVPPAMVGTLGLALFLYAVGIQYGSQFFRGFTSSDGRKANVVALIGFACAGAVTLAFGGGLTKLSYALGMFAGSGTSTAALQAVIQKLGSDDPAVGYSVAYPFGVAGPILFLYLFSRLRKSRSESTGGGQELLEIAIRDPAVIGRTLGEVTPILPPGVRIVAVREQDHNLPAAPELVLGGDDVVLAVGPSKESLERTRTKLGEAAAGRIADDRHDLDYLRVFASRPTVVGKSLGELAPPKGVGYSVMTVRRGDSDLVPRPDLVLEHGDRVALLCNRASFPAVRKFFGDSIKGTAEFSYVSIGLGMAAGLLVGAIAVPIPGVGKLAIGLAGVLLVALVLGQRRRLGALSWTIPLSANLVLRNLGLTLFLAQVGMSSGPKFATTVAQTGFLFLGISAVILASLVVPCLVVGLYVFKMPFDRVAGIVAGATGNPAILAYSNKLVSSDQPDIGYAMIFPTITILKILFVDIVPAFFG